MKNIIDHNTSSAVIGHWRNGATISEIIGATGLFYLVIIKIIKSYDSK